MDGSNQPYFRYVGGRRLGCSVIFLHHRSRAAVHIRHLKLHVMMIIITPLWWWLNKLTSVMGESLLLRLCDVSQ